MQNVCFFFHHKIVAIPPNLKRIGYPCHDFMMEEEANILHQYNAKNVPYSVPMRELGSSIILLTNPQHELYKMELSFRSMREDKNGNVITQGDPLMNELGINSILGLIQTIVNQVTIMSNLEKTEVPVLMDFLGDTLAKDLMVNRIKYDIRTPSARDKIFFTALASAFICLKRAYQEGDRRFWKGTQQDIKTTVVSDGGRKSMFSKFNPWGGR
jgi:hypothetical protein